MEENPIFHARTKHIEVHYHYIREKVLEEEIEMVPTRQKNRLLISSPRAFIRQSLRNFERRPAWSARQLLREVCLEGEC